jgi:hypothetical protein
MFGFHIHMLKSHRSRPSEQQAKFSQHIHTEIKGQSRELDKLSFALDAQIEAAELVNLQSFPVLACS